MPYLGIDFGTSNCVLADFQLGQPTVLLNRDGRRETPSVVTLRRDGSLAFGQEAKENFDPDRSVRSVKRVLGSPERIALKGKELRPEQVATMLFSLLKRDAEAALRQEVQKAVVTIPANSKGLARHATKLCAGAAGLQVLTLINEPTAAAIAYGLDATADMTVLVYDFGGGTLDVTLLRVHHGIFEEVGGKGVSRLGGDDLDIVLGEHLAQKFAHKTGYDILHSPHRSAFMLAVEEAKIELSSSFAAVARKPMLVPEERLNLEEEIDRTTFERLLDPYLQQSGQAIDEALRRSGLRASSVDRVLLVGGTSKIPRVREFVAEKLGREPEPAGRSDPMTCVAEGAAVVSAILQGAPGLDNHAYSVKLEHSLCAMPYDHDTGRPYLDPIIARGSDIPCSATKLYFPMADPAELITLHVYEGDVYEEPDHDENVKLAEIPWEYEPPRPRGEAGLEVTYEYGDDGILTVAVHDLNGRTRQRYTIDLAAEDALTPRQVEKLQKINADLLERTERVESTPAFRTATDVLHNAEQGVLPRLNDTAARAELEAAIRGLRAAIASGETDALEGATQMVNNTLLNVAQHL